MNTIIGITNTILKEELFCYDNYTISTKDDKLPVCKVKFQNGVIYFPEPGEEFVCGICPYQKFIIKYLGNHKWEIL